MPSQSYLTYRVRGIPDGLSRTSVKELIQKAVGCADGLEFRVKSLAKDLTRADQMVATFILQNPSPNLPKPSGVAEQSYEVLLDSGTEIELVIDTHFHGCTPLHCPDEEKWKFDLIAISGLNGHAFGSFKKPGASYMWLRDTLAHDVPESRIIIYGYDSKLQDSDSFQNVNDIGRKFQHAVREARRNSEKPLILLGHSLGGIVIKEALHLMRTSTISEDTQNFSAISGILFFGVPNQGMDIGSLIPLVANQANCGLLHALERNSAVLRTLAQQYSDVITDLRCDVVNFYETKQSPTALKRDDGTWAMNGPQALLVDPHSATHGRPNDSERHRIHPIDRTHSNLVKFSSAYDETYATVLRYLRSFNTDMRNGLVLPSLTPSQHECLKALGFPEQSDRIDMLEPDNRTCDWLFTNDTFLSWLRSRQGLLWIRGNPGCGKSMSMKRTLQYLQGQSNASQLLAHFFFHGQGNHLQSSSLGLYRSLLHQLYSRVPDCFPDLTRKFEEYRRNGPTGWRWMNGEVRHFFLKSIIDVSRQRPTILLIDALDEAGESEAKTIANDLKSLVGASRSESAQLHICFSCRHYPQITFSGGETLVMDEINRYDIQTVVTSSIDAATCFDESEKHQLKSEILSKAKGIFQWATLVLDIVIGMREKGDSFRVVLQSIRQAPTPLERLYESLLNLDNCSNNDTQHQQVLKLFQWVVFAIRPLKVQELQHALTLDCNMTERSISEYQQAERFIALCDMQEKVKTLSRGLIKFVQGTDGGSLHAELIHHSVSEFLLHTGWQLLVSAPAMAATRLAHYQLSRSCLRYLFMTEVRNLRTFDGHLPFLNYALKGWVDHIILAKNEDRTIDDEFDNDLISFFEWPNDEAFFSSHPVAAWRRLDTGFFSDELVFRDMRLIHFLAVFGLQSPLRQLIGRGLFSFTRFFPNKQVNVKNALGQSPLIYALEGREKEAMRLLIQAGAETNGPRYCPPGLSPLALASRISDPDFAEILLAGGAKVNGCIRGTSVLHLAVRYVNEAVVLLLLDRGANVHAQDWSFLTPLQWALVHKKDTFIMMLMLLDYGADLSSWLPCKWSPFHVAAGLDEASVAEIMTKGRALASVQNRLRKTKYSRHPRDGTVRVLELLNPAGLDMRELSALREGGEFQQATTLAHTNGAFISWLIQKGADVNSEGQGGKTPLHWAVTTEAVEQLLTAGADIMSRDNLERTPLHLAAGRRNTESLATLLQHILDRYSRSMQEMSDEEKEKELQKLRVMVNAKCLNGTSPLHWAATSEAVELLVKAYADINSRDSQGRTPLDHAKSAGIQEVVEKLSEEEAETTKYSGKVWKSAPTVGIRHVRTKECRKEYWWETIEEEEEMEFFKKVGWNDLDEYENLDY